MPSTKLMVAFGAAIVAVVAVVLVINSSGDDSASARDMDGAFVTQMVPHHDSAIEMANIAERRAQHPEIANLADNIVSSQGDEISEMNQIHTRLFGSPIDKRSQGDLGMDASMMGMDMDIGALATAKSFDREFIDQMIPHHQGAIRMAWIELNDGADPQTQELANNIIAAQSAEINQMNEWRTKWYGEPSPSGGIPVEGDEGSGHDMDSMHP